MRPPRRALLRFSISSTLLKTNRYVVIISRFDGVNKSEGVYFLTKKDASPNVICGLPASQE
jgi:hypothetical protein